MALRFPGGDLVAPLRFPEVAVSGVTTARPGVMHVCSGTAADYTVTLQPASACAGKHIGFRMAAGLTKLVTLKGDGAELIEGVNTRLMRANEVAILYCDGAAWTKVAGKTIPMAAEMRLSANQLNLAGNYADNTINLDSVVVDAGGMADPVAHKIKIKRPGRYELSGFAQLESSSFGASLARFITYAKIAGEYFVASEIDNINTGQSPISSPRIQFDANAGAEILWIVRTSHPEATVDIVAGSRMAVTEIPTW